MYEDQKKGGIHIMTNKSMYVILGSFIVLILLGQGITYGMDTYSTETNSWVDEDGEIQYSISTNTSSKYSAVLFDNDKIYDIKEVLVYYDPDYPTFIPLSYLVDKVRLMLSDLGIRNVVARQVDAEETLGMIERELEANKSQTALVMMSGAFPFTIYDGTKESPILKWLSIGGVVYWTGEQIGKNISKADGTTYQIEGYGDLFFGTSDNVLQTGSEGFASVPSEHNHILNGLGAIYNGIMYGINTDVLTLRNLSIGYTYEGQASMVLSEYHDGDGMIVVMGGNVTIDSSQVMAQLIASNINYSSTIVGKDTGSVNRGTINGSFDPPEGSSNLTLFIYLGVPMATYAKSFVPEGWQ